MILYDDYLFGFTQLYRLHGSAALRAVIPALFSTSILLVGMAIYEEDIEDGNKRRPVEHPYVIQLLIFAFSFLITFRANFAYQRYWEATTVVHQMISKWLDVGINLASYHYQQNHYQDIRPPAFGKHPRAKNLTRERERLNEMSSNTLKEKLSDSASVKKRGGLRSRFRRQKPLDDTTTTVDVVHKDISSISFGNLSPVPERKAIHLEREERMSRPVGGVNDWVNAAGAIKNDNPSLFLQEAAHLLSLMSAVAMSTLRNDIEGAESPLVEYFPGDSWPPVDPDMLSSVVRAEYHEKSRVKATVKFLFGLSRNDRNRTLYNAARPFGVLGGVSDVEIQLLQRARGPYAKVSLCSMWLEEYISREYMAGSTGDVAPPIISRLYQMISDGMVGYNQSRKIAYNPYPFPAAQGTIAFLLVTVLGFPTLYYTYVNNLVLACILNFVTVMCFVGLHEVARELEAPFFNAPNDIPLTTFQAEFNSALVVMYSGFHPDSWWEVPEKLGGEDPNDVEQEEKAPES